MEAAVTWVNGEQFVGVSTSKHAVPLDAAKEKVANSPMELVLAALCGCTAYDVVSILRKKREPVTAVAVSAKAEKAPQPPRVYTAIELLYRVRGTVSRKSVEDAVRLSEEKYCSVAAMLNRTARISYRIQLDAE